MPLIPYGLARPFLFRMDPEAAHEMAVALLARWQGTPLQWAWGGPRVNDPVTLAGLRLPNRVGLAAGLDKNAQCIDALAGMGFGFVEVGTVTPLAQPGNPRPRLFRLPAAQALINRMGFNNEGLVAFLANVQRARFRQASGAPMCLGLNIGKNAATPMERATDDYLAGLSGVYPHADYVAVNISSPNTKNLRELQAEDALHALLAALKARQGELADQHGRYVPVFLKIAPDLDEAQVQAIATALRQHGMDGVIATNTTLARDAVQGMPHAEEAGGLSGAPVREASNRVVRQLRAALGPGFPIIGAGGILSGADAVAKIEAGADAVQIYTGLIYKGPALVAEAARAIRKAAPAAPATSSGS
ncbi:quinone-dependent dihydroorotate dehydrogenase [Comamonadaceae bacterium OH2545_COT-014]|nr:quinone-dependent dihydroorotate dehydrogenase [Comamonadaceae bacterium OH2545_COT-014]